VPEYLEAAAKSMEGEELAAFEEACRETYLPTASPSFHVASRGATRPFSGSWPRPKSLKPTCGSNTTSSGASRTPKFPVPAPLGIVGRLTPGIQQRR
jgi:hypothetical protein